jgi:hypothetical protein
VVSTRPGTTPVASTIAADIATWAEAITLAGVTLQ